MGAKKAVAKVNWQEVPLVPVILLFGPENFPAQSVITRVKEALKQESADLAIHEISADAYSPGDLLTLASPSLFGEPRLIIVNAVEKSSDVFLKEASAYIEALSPDTTLILRHGGGVKGKAFLTAVRSLGEHGIEVDCKKIAPRERPDILRSEAKRLGVRIDNFALRQLLDAYQESLDDLVAALRQVAQLSSSKSITVEDVEGFTGGRVEAGAFKVADAAIQGRTQDAVLNLRQSLTTGGQPLMILGALNSRIKTMAKLIGAEGTPGSLAKTLGMAPWQVENARRDLHGWREDQLAKLLDYGADAEGKLKGGSRDPLYVLEKYTLMISRKGV